MKLSGKKIVILAASEFEDVEVTFPFLRLSEEGAWITLGVLAMGFHPRPAFQGKPITGRFGTTIPFIVNKEGKRYDIRPVGDLSPKEFDAVIIPGGFAPDYLRRDPATVNLVRTAAAQGKPIGAICHGPWLMISAGIVLGRRVTGIVAIKDDLENAGATFVDEAVVVDGNIVSSRNPDDLPEFCRAIIDLLC